MFGLPTDTLAVGFVPTDWSNIGISICPVIKLGLATLDIFFYKY
jgi:hypothetical protein